MFGNRWRPFSLLGIPISIDASWLIILALLTLSLASVFPILLHEYFPGLPSELAPYEYWFMGLVAALAFFACLLIAWGVLQFFGGNWLSGIWTGLMGMFLNSAARGSYEQVLVRQAL
jgi:hypothetical protein